MRNITLLHTVLVLIFFLSGCGITSRTPILGKNESDQLDDAPGYWRCAGSSADVKNTQDYVLYLIEDKSTGRFFNKDYVYRVKKLTGKNDPFEIDEWILRARKYNSTYTLQSCDNDNDSKLPSISCSYVYAIKQGELFNVFLLHERNISSEIKDLLGDLYINAKDRNAIELPNDFVATHGKKLIDTIGRSLPKADLTDKVTGVCKKISGEQARAIFDANIAAEEKEAEEKAAKNLEEEKPSAQ